MWKQFSFWSVVDSSALWNLEWVEVEGWQDGEGRQSGVCNVNVQYTYIYLWRIVHFSGRHCFLFKQSGLFFMGIHGLKETTWWRPLIWKPTHLRTVTPSGRPIFTPTVVRIRTHALWDPKAPKSAWGSTVEIGKEGYLLQSNTLGSAWWLAS